MERPDLSRAWFEGYLAATNGQDTDANPLRQRPVLAGTRRDRLVLVEGRSDVAGMGAGRGRLLGHELGGISASIPRRPYVGPVRRSDTLSPPLGHRSWKEPQLRFGCGVSHPSTPARMGMRSGNA